MKTIDLKRIIRPNIQLLKPYSSARDEFNGQAQVFLDANESPFENGYNRYPDPHQRALKERIAELKGVRPDQLFLGNGSDEAIDLLYRMCCIPGKSNVVIPSPTYGMYTVSADINDIAVRTVRLGSDFDLDVDAILGKVDEHTRLIFLCSPNNPTGNLLDAEKIAFIMSEFDGLVVIDEAYIDFTGQDSWTQWLNQFQNLVVLQTLSKAWGMAGLRLGLAMASAELIRYMDRVKPPYNISSATQHLALSQLSQVGRKDEWVASIVKERARLRQDLERISRVEMIYPSQANFILCKMQNAAAVYEYLIAHGVVVRDRSAVAGCENCLRISVGTPEENTLLIELMKRYA
ncbi:MAG: histidinol-phosphate transaminase [Cyclobacteriaceae bacterium]|nr:histidinol-phosphate transaminase [Cyclobacteriaceae bacterium]